MQEAKKDGNIILFIDELHTLVGTGSAEGAVDAANILKPALSRGEIQVIGATTLNEYRKYIEKDAALERRFQPVTVGEPSQEAALELSLIHICCPPANSALPHRSYRGEYPLILLLTVFCFLSYHCSSLSVLFIACRKKSGPFFSNRSSDTPSSRSTKKDKCIIAK